MSELEAVGILKVKKMVMMTMMVEGMHVLLWLEAELTKLQPQRGSAMARPFNYR